MLWLCYTFVPQFFLVWDLFEVADTKDAITAVDLSFFDGSLVYVIRR